MRNSKRGAGAIEGSVDASSNVLHPLDLGQAARVARPVRDDGAVGGIDGLVHHVQHVVLPVQRQPGRRVGRRVEGEGVRQVVAAVAVLQQRQRRDVARVGGDVEVHRPREIHERGERQEELRPLREQQHGMWVG